MSLGTLTSVLLLLRPPLLRLSRVPLYHRRISIFVSITGIPSYDSRHTRVDDRTMSMMETNKETLRLDLPVVSSILSHTHKLRLISYFFSMSIILEGI